MERDQLVVQLYNYLRDLVDAPLTHKCLLSIIGVNIYVFDDYKCSYIGLPQCDRYGLGRPSLEANYRYCHA